MTTRQQKRIIHNLPDITAARQEMVRRDFRDIMIDFQQGMSKLGLCDGNKCKYHRTKSGMHSDTCYCQRAMDAQDTYRSSRNPKDLKALKYWNNSHLENCSQGHSMERNLGCKGYVMEGTPLYQGKLQGRKVI